MPQQTRQTWRRSLNQRPTKGLPRSPTRYDPLLDRNCPYTPGTEVRCEAPRVSYVGGAATSQFALLPNPNPSGNFTKVTQRIPVRLEIVQQQGRLRPGMMVEATIDVVD
ncbi:hypothetical protein [Brevundimonas nasdae]|uniref:HlyD family secretion protein n=1 Tax=Brevundimonas nasdae TaxID=172043 RepID=UPI001969DD30|nr:hypothetical protein [Brevundimonas nasdae]